MPRNESMEKIANEEFKKMAPAPTKYNITITRDTVFTEEEIDKVIALAKELDARISSYSAS